MADQNDSRDRGWLRKILPTGKATETGAERSTVEASNDRSDNGDGDDSEIVAPAEGAPTQVAGDASSDVGDASSDVGNETNSAERLLPLNEHVTQEPPAAPNVGLSMTRTQDFPIRDYWSEPTHLEVRLAAPASESTSQASEPTAVDSIAPPETVNAPTPPPAAEEKSAKEASPEMNDGSVNGYDLDAYGLPMAATEPTSGHRTTRHQAAEAPVDEPPDVKPAAQMFEPEKEFPFADQMVENGEQDFRAATPTDENPNTESSSPEGPGNHFVPGASETTPLQWPEATAAEPAAQDREALSRDYNEPGGETDDDPSVSETPLDVEETTSAVETAASHESRDPGSQERVDGPESCEEVVTAESDSGAASNIPSIEEIRSAEAVVPVDEVSPGDSATLSEEAPPPLMVSQPESEGRAIPESEKRTPEDQEPYTESAVAQDDQAGDDADRETTRAADEHGENNWDGPTEAYSYLVSDARFEVVEGALQLKDGVSLDGKREPTIDVLVATIDADGDSAAENYTVTVEDGGRPESIPLNNPLVESEPTEEAEPAAAEQVSAGTHASPGEDAFADEAVDSGQAGEASDSQTGIEPASGANTVESRGAKTGAADSEEVGEESDVESEETLSVKSIEDTLSFDEPVEEPEARHDFLLLGSGDDATADSAPREADVPQETKDEAPSLFGEDEILPAQESRPPAADLSDEEASEADTDSARDDAEWDLFLFEPEDTALGGNRPSAQGGEAETLDLSEVAESGRSWTILLNDGSEIKGTGEDYLDLTEDASGTITFDDGTEMTFDSVERVTW